MGGRRGEMDVVGGWWWAGRDEVGHGSVYGVVRWDGWWYGWWYGLAQVMLGGVGSGRVRWVVGGLCGVVWCHYSPTYIDEQQNHYKLFR